MSQLDFNDNLEVKKALLSFVQKISSTNVNLYFILRPTTSNKKNLKKVVILISIDISYSKLINYYDSILGVYYMCILVLVTLEIIAIANSKNYLDFI